MKFFFSFIDDFYSEKNQWKNCEEIFSLEISQSTNCFAFAKILVKNSQNIYNKKFAKIGISDQLDRDDLNIKTIFVGKIMSIPIESLFSCVELELISEPPDYCVQINQSKEKLNEKPYYDNLFDRYEQSTQDIEILNGRTSTFYWDKATGKLSVVDIIDGNCKKVIKSNKIFKNSIKMHNIGKSIDVIKIKLEVQWMQKISGVLNLGDVIASKFKHGYVNSFVHFEKEWKNLSFSLEKNGYKIIESLIFKKSLLCNLPVASKVFDTFEDKENKKVQFKRFWYETRLNVYWQYLQPRKESIDLTVKNFISTNTSRQKNVHIKLQAIQLDQQYPYWNKHTKYFIDDIIINKGVIYKCIKNNEIGEELDENHWIVVGNVPDALCDESANSFFDTNRGRQAIMHALLRASSYIKYSAMCNEITFCGSIDDFYHISVGNQLHIEILPSDALNEKRKMIITGIVNKVTIYADSNRQFVQIKINTTDNFNCADINNQKIDIDNLTIDNLDLKNISFNDSINSLKLTQSDILKDIQVTSQPDDQEKYLSTLGKLSLNKLKNEIKLHGVKIKILLGTLHQNNHKINRLNLTNLGLNRQGIYMLGEK